MLNKAQDMSSTFLSNLNQTQHIDNNVEEESLETIHDGNGSTYDAARLESAKNVGGLFAPTKSQMKQLKKATENPKHFYSTFKSVPITSLLKLHTEGNAKQKTL